jgi:uncharacterized repeat protein (TIGR03803 family)
MHPANSSFRPALQTAALAAIVFALSFFLSASAPAQTVTTLQNFNGTNGANPFMGALTQGRDGKLYGTTYYGGGGYGTVFRFNPATNFISVLHSFASADGGSPAGGLTLATDGNYYGTTNYGGSAGLGVLFKITSGGTYTLLHSFLGGSDGEFGAGAPIQASDGNLYGVTVGGFSSGDEIIASTVYKYTRTGAYSVVYSLATSTGLYTEGVMQGSDGNLYVTANGGGANGCGSIVKLTLAGVLRQVHSFSCNNNGGANPVAALVQASNGNYYGTTPDGGASDFGVLYELGPTFGETVSHTFTSSGARTPEGGLVQGTDGNLYGVSMSSGNLDGGTLYTWNPSTLVYSELYQFTGDGNILAPLMQQTSGLFYGTSQEQGTHSDGFLFSVDMSLGPFIAFVSPTGNVGSSVQILGQGLTGATGVTFNGVASSSFAIVSDTYMTAVVPTGATTGAVAVTTPGGTLTSNVSFRVSE